MKSWQSEEQARAQEQLHQHLTELVSLIETYFPQVSAEEIRLLRKRLDIQTGINPYQIEMACET